MENSGQVFAITGECPLCGSDIAIKRRKKDNVRFVACTSWPECNWASDYNPVVNTAINNFMDDYRKSFVRRYTEKNGDADRKFVAVRNSLKELVFFAHPDRNPRGVDACEITARLNAILTKIGR